MEVPDCPKRGLNVPRINSAWFLPFPELLQGTNAAGGELPVMASTTIVILEKPITRIRETCEMIGAGDRFDRMLPDLETYLEGEVASGETSETRLTYHGLVFLQARFAER
jgi:hypothetical protein